MRKAVARMAEDGERRRVADNPGAVPCAESFCGAGVVLIFSAYMLARIIPFFAWIRGYDWKRFPGTDLPAGVIVAIMLVPQSMAYAMLAGLPPVVGLYASTIPILVHALFTTSRHLTIGPVAIVSLLVFSTCRAVAEPGSEAFVRASLLLALMVGVTQWVLGFCRAGFILGFVSHTVSRGFISAAAILICLSQIGHLLGIPMSNSETVLPVARELLANGGRINLPTLAVGLGSVGILAGFRLFRPRVPAGLLVVALGTFCAWLGGLETMGVATVGTVPRGLPGLTLPPLDMGLAANLWHAIPVLLLVAHMQSISVGKMVASRERYRIDPNAEFRALGLANVTASFFSGFAVDGSLSRTAVNRQAGARTAMSSLLAGGLVLATLAVLTPLFRHLPKAVLASIIVVAALPLVDVPGARRLLRLRTSDGVCFLLTFGTVLSMGVARGVLAGIVFSLALVLWRNVRPAVVELGYVESKRGYRDVARHPDAVRAPGALILRMDRSLYFTNADFLQDVVREAVNDRPGLKRLILDFSGVNDIDATGIEAMEEIINAMAERGLDVRLAGLKGAVRDAVARAGWPERHGDRVSFPTIDHALETQPEARSHA